jgi:hypothetical protein
MKRITILSLISLAIVLAFVFAPVALAADTPPAPPPVIPDLVVYAIGLGVVWAIVNGLKALSERLGADLTPGASGVALIVTAIIVVQANNIIAWLVAANPSLGPPIAGILGFLVIVLGAMGLKRTEVKARPPAVQQVKDVTPVSTSTGGVTYNPRR